MKTKIVWKVNHFDPINAPAQHLIKQPRVMVSFDTFCFQVMCEKRIDVVSCWRSPVTMSTGGEGIKEVGNCKSAILPLIENDQVGGGLS